MASAASQYINELEKSGLQKYQNNSVCEVLSYEFSDCSQSEKTKLERAFNTREVLTNYCQPHLPPPKNSVDANLYMKGADLYSWKDQSGFQWYTLLPGTNRQKTTKELIENKMSFGLLKESLSRLSAHTEIAWNNLAQVDDKKNLEFSLPAKVDLSEIQAKSNQAKLKLNISEPE
jgi:hypothetical protein